MAAVPELASEMMAYYSGNENDLFFEADGPRQTKCSFQDLDLSSLGDGAIQLQVSQQLHNASFRKIVSVVVAMEKLRKVPIVFSQDFQDDDLRSLFFLIFEEETISCLWDDTYVCDAPLQSLNCRLQDVNHKALVLSGPHELQAVHLNGQDVSQQVVFCMSFMPGEENNKTPVALGIKEKNLYLSCVMKDDKPTLQLETVDSKGLSKKMEKRFVFNKTEINSKVEFESALYPNWYISTLQEEQRPVFLGNQKGGKDITDFTLDILSR
ncbi:PREDICTED: interleukin-1 beta isoform X1 [Hipposideros armiger]|uniref:Multifunctional fusion protein n=1 Tax=Hipposideros armiger TaxID=186990 RepID=A0A8B7T1K7_HIPAR|nr:PREDICTED: interleukin-1 beta isoform X1 [Hipposideros armiger]